jgi:ankyrin repeat protein
MKQVPNTRDELCATFLKAAKQGNLPLVEQCIFQGAEVDLLPAEIPHYTALCSAAQYGHLSIVKFLVQQAGASTHSTHQRWQDPFHAACVSGNLEIVDFLAGTGVDLSARRLDRNTALHFACQFGHVEVVQYLTSKDGVDINKTGKYGWTPLHTA